MEFADSFLLLSLFSESFVKDNNTEIEDFILLLKI